MASKDPVLIYFHLLNAPSRKASSMLKDKGEEEEKMRSLISQWVLQRREPALGILGEPWEGGSFLEALQDPLTA